MRQKSIDVYSKLLCKLYENCNYNDFQIAVDFALRASQRIREDDIFNLGNVYLRVINCEDKLISDLFEYYLDGKGEKENLREDIFPIINVLSHCDENIVANELRNMFTKVYATC